MTDPLKNLWLQNGGELHPLEDRIDFSIAPDLQSLKTRVNSIDPEQYARSRNHLEGATTELSPFFKHGLIEIDEVVEQIKQVHPESWSGKFFQELIYREYFHYIAREYPQYLKVEAQEYKTGWKAEDYSKSLPKDIESAKTPCALINEIIEVLVSTGFLHNRCRLYLASYVVHFRRVHWLTGAQWMLSHLIDGDVACNHLSWQWVASSFSAKPYLFNLESARQFFPKSWNLNPSENLEIDASFEELNASLFPNRKSS